MNHVPSLLLLAATIIASQKAHGQVLTALDALRFGGTLVDHVSAMATDASGNIILGGRYQGTTDFNPGTGIFQLTSAGSNDGFVLKLDPAGNFMWAASFGSSGADGVNALVVDGTGNILVTGIITGTVDMDPGPDALSLAAGGFDDMVLCKYDPSGALLWAVATNTTNGNAGYTLDVGPNGDVVVGGVFYGSTDLNAGTGAFDLDSNGEGDAYLCKYTSSGIFSWGRRIGGPLRDEITCIAVGPDGSISFGGLVRGTLDIDPGPGVVTRASAGQTDIIEGKLDASGNTIWVHSSGGTGYDEVYSMDIGSDGSINTTGYFEGTVDFDPGGSEANLTAISPDDGMAYVRRLTANGQFLWAKGIGGADGAAGFAVRALSDGGIAACGGFIGSMDLDPGPGTRTVSSNGDIDGFVIILNGSGDHLNSMAFGSTLRDEATTLAPWNDQLLCGGFFRGTLDLNGAADPPPLVANGDYDGFLLFLQEGEDVSIGELALEGQLIAFPNPTDGELNVVMNSTGNVPYRILDELGRTALEGQFTPGMNSLRVGSLAPGNYWISTEEGNTHFILN